MNYDPYVEEDEGLRSPMEHAGDSGISNVTPRGYHSTRDYLTDLTTPASRSPIGHAGDSGLMPRSYRDYLHSTTPARRHPLHPVRQQYHPYYPHFNEFHDVESATSSGHSGGSSADSLASLFEAQKKIINMVEKVTERIGVLEKAVTQLNEKTEPNSRSQELAMEDKKRLPTDLSRNVARIHEAFHEQDQFRPHLGSKNEHNVKVKRAILAELSLHKENHYSQTLIERAIQRYFESRRRSWREETDPNQEERVTLQKKKRRVRARKQRLYERRYKHTHEGEEKERFKQLNLDCMSEESSDGEKQMAVHQPVWRSRTLNTFCAELDTRASLAREGSQKHVPERNLRVQKSPLSEATPPPGCPKWAISKDWLKLHLEFTVDANTA